MISSILHYKEWTTTNGSALTFVDDLKHRSSRPQTPDNKHQMTDKTQKYFKALQNIQKQTPSMFVKATLRPSPLASPIGLT